MDIRKGKQLHHPWQPLGQTLKMMFLATLVLSCIFFINQIKWSRYFPIKTVRVYGVNRISQQEVQELLFPLVNRGFFTINVDTIKDRLLQIPWVSHIFVRRQWPDQVEITIVERHAVARWNDNSLLSEGGELFTPQQETYPVNLPQFIGPPGKQIVVLTYFYKINRLFLPLHAKISRLEMTPYFTWKLALDNGITLQIGHKDILTRLGHFVKVYPKILESHKEAVEYVDLRYSNGMAIRWKTTPRMASLGGKDEVKT